MSNETIPAAAIPTAGVPTGPELGDKRARKGRRATRVELLALLAVVGLAIAGCRCAPDHEVEADFGNFRVAEGSGEPSSLSPPPEVVVETANPRDPSVLVVLHDYDGLARSAGLAMADVMGANVVSFAMGPDEPVDSNPAAFEEIRQAVGNGEVGTVFLGFPIWDGIPSAPIRALIETVDWSGRRVVPFYTFHHHFEPTSLRDLVLALRDGGGEVPSPIGLQLPLMADAGDVRSMLAQRLTSRLDLWWNQDQDAQAQCDRANQARDDSSICHIPEGWVWVNYPERMEDGRSERRLRLEQIPAFSVDLAEVHVGGYESCVAAGACPSLDVEGSFCRELMSEDYFPVPCAGPRHAEAFCTWAGMRVPTLAEWTRAARGDTSRNYPWGGRFSFSGELGNFGETAATGFPNFATIPNQSGFSSDGHPGLSGGCSFPEGRSVWGPCDMSGNLSEIVRLDDERYGIVGGSWVDWDPSAVRLDHAAEYPLSRGSEMTGFRCVR